MRRVSWMVVMIGAMVALGGCASKKMVNDGLSSQDARMDDIETQVEQNQRGLKSTGQRLDQVAQETQSAQATGQAAAQQADKAYSLAQGKLLYTVVLDDTAGIFKVDSAALSDEMKAKLDAMAAKLVKDNQRVYLEVAGHTDATGPEAYNMRLGLMRAEAVRRYLNGEHSIPLHHISVISYGESKPVAGNDTREGRARNRRVEIRVLS